MLVANNYVLSTIALYYCFISIIIVDNTINDNTVTKVNVFRNIDVWKIV